jgi:hypothetical protein
MNRQHQFFLEAVNRGLKPFAVFNDSASDLVNVAKVCFVCADLDAVNDDGKRRLNLKTADLATALQQL